MLYNPTDLLCAHTCIWGMNPFPNPTSWQLHILTFQCWCADLVTFEIFPDGRDLGTSEDMYWEMMLIKAGSDFPPGPQRPLIVLVAGEMAHQTVMQWWSPCHVHGPQSHGSLVKGVKPGTCTVPMCFRGD